jgi:argininosuccinate synthase
MDSAPPETVPDKPEIITITFENGITFALKDKKMNGVDLIFELTAIKGCNGVDRDDLMEDRILGLKSHEIYEHLAATVLIAVYADLEKRVLFRFELMFKHIVDDQWAELAYIGLLHELLHHDLNAFVDGAQKRVVGTVDMRLFKGGLPILGRKSPNAIYSRDMVLFDATTTDQREVIGFSKYFGLQGRTEN